MTLNYPKKCVDKISDHFSAYEMDCPCSACTETLVDSDLMPKLEAIRAKTGGAAVVITSGYRCQAHQDDLKSRGFETAVGVSQHTLGRAADIRCGTLTGPQLEAFARAAGFRAVGTGKMWVHVDLRDNKDRSWVYSY